MPPPAFPGRVQPPLVLLKVFHYLHFRLDKAFVSFSSFFPSRHYGSISYLSFFAKIVSIFRKFVSRLLHGMIGIKGGDEMRGNEGERDVKREAGADPCNGSASIFPLPEGQTPEALGEENGLEDELGAPMVPVNSLPNEDEPTTFDSTHTILEEEPIVDEPEFFSREEQIPVKVKKKALLIGIRKLQSTSEVSVLNGPHRDVADMRGLLEGLYGYHPSDIVSLIDNDEPGHIQPTKENILLQIGKLVEGAQNGDRFFFFFAGHSTQEDTEDIWEEEDGKNELIVTSDNQTIMDNELRERLVDPLPVNCSLFAVFDTCHSCSLLDLPHFRCNRIYVPWINRGIRRTDTLLASNQRKLEAIASPTLRQRALTGQLIRQRNSALSSEFDHETAQGKHPSGSRPKLLRVHVQGGLGLVGQSEPDLVPVSFLGERHYDDRDRDRDYEEAVDSPVSMFCDGNCRKCPIWSQRRDNEPKADVVCLSSSKDSQVTWEDPLGNSMTRSLVTYLEENPRRSLKDVLTHVSHSIYNRYVDLHDQARGYKKEIKTINLRRLKLGQRPLVGQNVEMHNFQDPQISSCYPLDMDRYFEP